MRLLAARGLAVGEIGRGSFVRAPAQAAAAAFRPEPAIEGIIDLSRNAMPLPGLAARFQSTALAVLRREPDLATYRTPGESHGRSGGRGRRGCPARARSRTIRAGSSSALARNMRRSSP